MALSIPIISEFDGKGIDRAIKEFKQLETAGEKAHFLIKKAAIPAAAALAGVTTALTFAVKAAMEDELAQAKLAQTLEKTVGATEAQVKATEDMISAMSRATGTADDELRPAFAALVLGSHDVGKATAALSIAQDIATSTGKSLAEVSSAMSLGFGGNMRALAALSPELKSMIKEGASLDTVMSILADNFGGATAAAADTAAGKFKIMKNSIAETKESIGAALLPAVAAVLPYLQKMADWAQNNPKLFLIVAGTIAAVAASIMAVNFAMALNPFGLIVIGTAAAGVAIYALSVKFETFGNGVKTVINSVIGYINGLVSAMYMIYNAVALVQSLIPGLATPQLTAPQIPLFGGFANSGSQSNAAPFTGDKDLGVKVPAAPTFSVPTMPAPGAPLSSGGGSSSGGGGGAPLGVQGLGGAQVGALTTFGIAERIAARGDTITVNVNGGISTGPQIGQAVYNALLNYKQVYGPLDALAT